MKKIFFIITIVFLSVSCEKDFKQINTEIDKFSYVEPETIMTGVVLRTMNLVADLNKRAFWSYSHYLTIEGGPMPRYGGAPGDMDGYWQRFYVDVLGNLNQILIRFDENPEYANRIQMAKIWKSYIYWMIVGIWGPVPYSEASDITKKTYKYDSELSIYTDLLQTLKTAEETLDEKGDFWSSDMVFSNHSILSWKKFALSLRLKIALQISDVNPALAQEHISDIMSKEDLLISDKSDEVKVYWGAESDTYSPYFNEYNKNRGTDLGTFPFLSHFLFLYLRAYNDPRLEVFARKATSDYIVYDTMWVKDPKTAQRMDTVAYIISYGINYYAMPKSTRILDCWHLEGVELPMPSKYSMYSEVNPSYIQMVNYQMIISSADVSFMKAEVAQKGLGGSKTASEYYYEGIQKSFEQYNLESGKYEDYVKVKGVEWETAGKGLPDFRGIVTSDIKGEPLEQIAVQRWLTNYFWGGFDAWCLQRRFRALDLPPHFNPSPPTTTSELAADLPERLPYPKSEDQLNHDQMKEAYMTYLGGFNDMNSVLYFAKQPVRKDWCSVVPRINNDVVQYFHGKTIDEVIASGADFDTALVILKRQLE